VGKGIERLEIGMKAKAQRKGQRGIAVMEALLVLIVGSIATSVAIQQYGRHLDAITNKQAADHATSVADAAAQYLKDNFATVAGAAGPTTPATITMNMLKTTGYLPTGFSDRNAFGQEYLVRVIEPQANQLQAIVVTTGGQAIRELDGRRVAQYIGARGGFVSANDATKATGSFGGWEVALTPYGVAPGAGHLATALFLEDGALVSDYLYRNSVAGRPEVNRMNTSIEMNGNNVSNAGTVSSSVISGSSHVTAPTVYATSSVTSGTASAATVSATNVSATNVSATTASSTQMNTTNGSVGGELYVGGWVRSTGDAGWYNQKWGGGWYMTDPTWVRSYANKNVYTGGEVQAGAIRSNGRTYVGEYLQLGGVANEGWGCSPNGLVGRTSAGLTLSCQSGVWRSNAGGGAPSCSAIAVSTTRLAVDTACPAGYTKMGFDTHGADKINYNGQQIGSNYGGAIFCCAF
jgi:hypothetical protein